jgi:hypothetical protein
MNELEQLADMVQQLGKNAKALSSSGMMRKSVIVHPQLSKTPQEAKQLDSDWQSKEDRQLLENINRLLF